MFKINKKFCNANISRTIGFNEELFEELNKALHKENISFNMLVLQCCRFALDNMQNTNENNIGADIIRP